MSDPFVLVDGLEGRTAGALVALDDDTDHHLRRVLRLSEGAPLQVSDGRGRVAAARLDERGARLRTAPVAHPQRRPSLRVLQALPKGRKVEDVVRTLTELGVARISIVETDRTVRTLTAKRERSVGRWRAIAASACQQARRPHRPTVDPPEELAAVLPSLEPADDEPLLVAEVGADRPLRPVAESLDDPDSVSLAVGPEGGWSDAERAAFTDAGAQVVSLGDTVLRTEHAAPVLAGVVGYATGWFG